MISQICCVFAQANDFAGHNSSLFVLGVMILWFGWYGFNPGSQLVLVGGTNSFAVSVCAVTTTLAPAAAGLSSLLVKALHSHFTTGARPAVAAAFPLTLSCVQQHCTHPSVVCERATGAALQNKNGPPGLLAPLPGALTLLEVQHLFHPHHEVCFWLLSPLGEATQG